MIRLDVIRAIVKRDLLDSLRDPTTLIVNYCLPVVFWPIVFAIVSGVIATDKTLHDKEATRVGLVGSPPPGFVPELEKNARIQLMPLAWDPPPNVEDEYLHGLLTRNHLEAMIFVDRGEKDESDFVVYLISALTKPAFDLEQRIKDGVHGFVAETRKQRARELAVSVSHFVPMTFETRLVASGSGGIVDTLARFLPFALIYVLCMATTQFAMNAIVVERTKGTLPLLFSAPILSLEIILGKFLFVMLGGLAVICLHTSSIVLGGLVVQTVKNFSVPIAAPFQLIVFITLLTASVGSLTLAAGSLGKNQSQSGGILSLSLIVLFGLGATTQSVVLSPMTLFLPLFNTLLAISTSLRAPLPFTWVAAIVVTNIVAIYGLLSLANQLLRMTSAGVPLQLKSEDFGKVKSDPHLHRTIPGPGLASGLILFAYFAVVYLGGFVRPPWGLVVTEAFAFMLVPLLVARRQKLDLGLAFNLRKPSLRSCIGGVLIGLSWPFAAFSVIAHLPFTPDTSQKLTEAMEKLLATGGLPLVIVYFALVPALFEEFFFRGIVLNGYRKVLPGRWAVALSAITFAVIHLNPIQIAFTLALGFIAGAALLRSGSLFVTIGLHFLYNSMVLSLAMPFFSNPLPTTTMILLFLVGIVGTGVGYWCLKPPESA